MPSQEAPRSEYLLGALEGPVKARLAILEREGCADRIWRREPALWKSEAAAQKSISNRLGWLTVADSLRRELGPLRALVDDARREGFTHSVVLGMGGSSLAPACFAHTFGAQPGYLKPGVLDLTAPAAVRAVDAANPIQKTLFMVSSKSGNTLESSSFYRYFLDRLRASGAKETGSHFLAITDPGSPLSALGKEDGFRRVFENPADIGGRYSALSWFGMVPAALAGVDVEGLLQRGSQMARVSHEKSPEDNPPLKLGAVLAEAALAGHDKVTILAGSALSTFGGWAEQLIAESTGKEGKGVIPIDGEPLSEGDHYGEDRLFVGLLLGDDDPLESQLRALAGPTRPVVLLRLRDTLDLGGEFFRWEMATAVAGAVLGINPFDEPNVTESKQNTAKILDAGAPAAPSPGGALHAIDEGGKVQDAGPALRALLQQAHPGDYLALQAYLPEEPTLRDGLAGLRLKLRDQTKLATTLGFGPRFLHSTGQLHKGGPNSGVFIQITGDPSVVGEEFPIPGAKYGFGRLLAAQAEGDRQSLRAKGRRLLHLHLGDKAALRGLASSI